ncbi:MAG TPA: hypothetical protein VIK91_18445 [Nannocystis sp.]
MSLAAALLTCSVLAMPPQRGNTVLDPETRRVFGVAVSARLGLLIGGGDVLFERRPPVGFGFGLALRYHALRAGPLRFGFELQAGHTRFPERRRFAVPADPTTPTDPNTGAPMAREVTRVSSLSHTDMTLGPSVQIPARVLLVEVGAGAGLMVSNWWRRRSYNPFEDEQTVGYDAMVRAGVSFAVPIRKNHGVALGVDFQKVFSKQRVVIEPPAEPTATAESAVVFDMLLNINLAYQAWF